MHNQTMEKLHQMRLAGMAAAIREQLDTPSTSDLSFGERVAMMVDREWTLRENKRLASRLKAAKLKLHASVENIDYRHPRRLEKSLVLTLSNCGGSRAIRTLS